MSIVYKKIFDLQLNRAKKMYNSSYLEELTGLIERTASLVDNATFYCFGEQFYLKNALYEPNSSYSDFINSFKDTFEFSSSDKIHIIRGRAGVGKTLFFKKGVQILTRNNHHTRYIPLSVDFKNIDSKQNIDFYVDLIYDKLNKNAIDCIRRLGMSEFKNFTEKYKEYCCSITDTPYAKLFPVMFFSKSIYNKYKKPCIIILDNIDLSCVKTQKNVFKATSIVCEKINEFMESQNVRDIYRVYFAMRPETYLHSEEAKLGDVINFPLPNIQLICLTIIKNIIECIAKEYDLNDSMKCEVTYYSVINNQKETAKSFLDVANYFNEIFDYFFNNIWKNDEIIERLGNNEDFHCNLVNYNVRTFLSFLADTLYNGGFKPLTKEFNDMVNGNYYNIFDYIEMLIRGRWVLHPGNKYIDGEGGNKAPIVFNVFDTNLWDNTQVNKIKHFMLNIRILQYFYLYAKDEEITYNQLETHLKTFFDKTHIKIAVQELTFVRILYSFFEGDDNIASKQSWDEVCIEKNTKLCLSPTGTFYIEKFICEFEYLYQMALSSLMPSDYVEDLSNCWKTEKEMVVLKFLEGMFSIIKCNLESYDNKELEEFKLIFCKDDDISCRPYRRMLNSFINVMNHKTQRAKLNETKSFEKLTAILTEAENLKNQAKDYFINKLGDEI